MKLTHEQIDAMEAGREMDALVAELVMGWFCDRRGVYHSSPSDDSLFGVLWSNDGEECDLFEPSTDIAAAWQVVEKLLSKDYEVHIEVDKDDCAVTIWHDPDNSSYWIEIAGADSKSTPLAICRAALKVVCDDASD